MESIVRARALSKHFGKNAAESVALRDIDVDVEFGEFVAVMGPSGCGKSTLLNMLGGLDRPTRGEVHLKDQRIDDLSEGRRAVLRRHSIGFVFQAFNLIGNLSVADNIELPALLAGVSTSEARQRRDTLLEQLGIPDKATQMPADLSGGEQQRVSVARALVNRPSLLLADEPTGNLDTSGTRDVLNLLKSYNSEGQAIVLVTHDPRVAASASRIIRMRDGQIADETRLDDDQDSRVVLSNLVDLEV
ncbi:MAG: ABC transporter ATP-binding protein [SAR202 cluster bacterium]|nr:ABC transporter ATP-binding protein [SAR202 cluster bacterium]